MLKKYALWATFTLGLLRYESILAQSTDQITHPVLGQTCPDFLLNDLKDYSAKSISLNQLKGKPFILDFFSTGCTACFASFPKINTLTKEFAGRVTFILVGRDDQHIRGAYETFKKRQKLLIPHVFDSTLFNKFGVNGVPYVIWVNANGIVTGITGTLELTDSTISAFSKGEQTIYSNFNLDNSLSLTIGFNKENPLTIDSIAWHESTFFQRSLVTAWQKNMGNFGLLHIEDYIEHDFPLQIAGWPLFAIYKFAYINQLADWETSDSLYYGNYHFMPIYELKDSSQFQSDWDLENNQFCYSQYLVKENRTPTEMLRIMRSDLYNAFGYNVSVETRTMPCLFLVAKDKNINLLRSNGGKIVEESYMDGIDLHNSKISKLINVIVYKNSLVSKDLPLIDKTGIDYPIDIHFKAAMTDIEDVKKELLLQGLEIVPGTKEMKVIVVRDKTDKSQTFNR